MSDLECLISRHFCKSLLQFFCDGFGLLLLRDKFIFKSVNFLLQFLNRFVSKFCSCLCLLQFCSEGFDLFLVGLLTLVGFFFSNSRDFRLLATTLSSSSNSKILVSPTSALSSAFSRSESHCTSFLETSS